MPWPVARWRIAENERDSANTEESFTNVLFKKKRRKWK